MQRVVSGSDSFIFPWTECARHPNSASFINLYFRSDSSFHLSHDCCIFTAVLTNHNYKSSSESLVHYWHGSSSHMTDDAIITGDKKRASGRHATYNQLNVNPDSVMYRPDGVTLHFIPLLSRKRVSWSMCVPALEQGYVMDMISEQTESENAFSECSDVDAVAI